MSDNSKNTAVEQAASETSTQAAQGATDYGYVSNGNNSGNVRLIKNYALFLFPKGDSTFVAPTGVNWTPPASKKPIGYSTEDGAVLHPEPGDSTDYKAHNGDIVLSDTDPGYWTLNWPPWKAARMSCPPTSTWTSIRTAASASRAPA